MGRKQICSIITSLKQTGPDKLYYIPSLSNAVLATIKKKNVFLIIIPPIVLITFWAILAYLGVNQMFFKTYNVWQTCCMSVVGKGEKTRFKIDSVFIQGMNFMTILCFHFKVISQSHHLTVIAFPKIKTMLTQTFQKQAEMHKSLFCCRI